VFALRVKSESAIQKIKITWRVVPMGLFRQVRHLENLSDWLGLDLHSIEQPIALGQIEAMRAL